MFTNEIKTYLLSLKGAYLDFPFDEVTPVYKVGPKMFALTGEGEEQSFRLNLKCDPNNALFLRDHHQSIIPGYHMNKKHWNTVIVDGTLSLDFIKNLIDESYLLVFKSLPKDVREGIMNKLV